MAYIYNFHYKGEIISYSEEQFREKEAEFMRIAKEKYSRKQAIDAHRLFCSKVDAIDANYLKGRSLEKISCC